MNFLVWEIIFFCPLTSGDRIFFLTYNGVIIFFRVIGRERLFFGVGILFFAWYFLARIFFPRNQSAGYFFLKSSIPRLKSQMVGPSLEGFLWEKQHLPPKY